MRYVTLTGLLIFCFVITGVFEGSAQNSAVNKAKLYLNNGEFEKACQTINQAVRHPETQQVPRAWFYRGKVYQALLEYPYTQVAKKENQEGLYRDSAAIMAQKADSSYKKVIALDQEGEYGGKAKDQRDDLWKVVVNEARYYLQQKKALNDVLSLGELAASIKPDDTTSHKIAGMAAKRLQQYDKVLHHYRRLKELQFEDPNIYQTLVVLNQKITHDTAQAFQLAKEGHRKYPEYLPLTDELAHLYIEYKGSPEKSIQYLKKLIEKKPENFHYRMRLGEAYNKAGNYPEAITHFNEAVELDSANFTAQYNLGALCLNYAKEQEKAEAQRKYMEKALLHLRKAREIKSQPKLDNIIQKLEKRLN